MRRCYDEGNTNWQGYKRVQGGTRMHRVAQGGRGTCVCIRDRLLHTLMSFAPVWQHLSAHMCTCADMLTGAGLRTCMQRQRQTKVRSIHRTDRVPAASSELPCNFHLQGVRSTRPRQVRRGFVFVALLSATTCKHGRKCAHAQHLPGRRCGRQPLHVARRARENERDT